MLLETVHFCDMQKFAVDVRDFFLNCKLSCLKKSCFVSSYKQAVTGCF